MGKAKTVEALKKFFNKAKEYVKKFPRRSAAIIASAVAVLFILALVSCGDKYVDICKNSTREDFGSTKTLEQAVNSNPFIKKAKWETVSLNGQKGVSVTCFIDEERISKGERSRYFSGENYPYVLFFSVYEKSEGPAEVKLSKMVSYGKIDGKTKVLKEITNVKHLKGSLKHLYTDPTLSFLYPFK
ncbi:MAG: hypothetical protein J6P03_01265 [Opitutales bacterium]|nr:hypothetical protein [Opitutales bacterium]